MVVVSFIIFLFLFFMSFLQDHVFSRHAIATVALINKGVYKGQVKALDCIFAAVVFNLSEEDKELVLLIRRDYIW